MKGQFSLFTDHFENTTTQTAERRPRNYYMPDRNKDLVYRYYYYAEIKFIRYDKCLEFLSREFYLTQPRIIDLLAQCNDLIGEIVKAKPTTKELQNKVPHFNW